MKNIENLTYFVIAGLIAIAIYRKNFTDPFSTPSSSSSDNLSTLTLSAADGSSSVTHRVGKTMSKSNVAKIAHQLQSELDENETIIQVHDYTNHSSPAGQTHIFDVTTFDSASTAAVTKRIDCIQKENRVIVTNMQIMSPITGSVMSQRDLTNDVSDLLLDDHDGRDGEDGAKFIRDKYAFIRKDEALPSEPPRLRTVCEEQIAGKNNIITKECQTDIDVYQRAMHDYTQQVNELRNGKQVSKLTRKIGFAPANETIDDHEKFPFSQPQTYGFAAHEEAPIDWSSLSNLKPLNDEQFFNSVALEQSTLALQYG
tara:strand:+ start:1812 stop:2750 length:939 start_codon:yes stop_codon:yes gene_type:complete